MALKGSVKAKQSFGKCAPPGDQIMHWIKLYFLLFIVESILSCDQEAQPWLFRNIVLTGGNACLPNIRERVEREVRTMAPDAYDVRYFDHEVSSSVLRNSFDDLSTKI